ncbi:MAG TPA: glycerophosphodiester phosphodiesterase family protein, partial [Actinomycetota bacterium]
MRISLLPLALIAAVPALLGLSPAGSVAAGPDCTEVPEPARWVDAGPPDAGAADPLISAHRGGNRLAPENTLWAYRHAFAYGADVVEADVRETSDGRWVVMHDDTVDRTTDGTGAVSSMTFAQIRQLNAADWDAWAGSEYDPSLVPSVEEVMALAASVGGGIEFDIKDVSDHLALADLAARYGILEESIFNSPDVRIVARYTEARLIYNRDTFEPPGSLYALGRTAYAVYGSRLDEYSPESIAEVHDACGLVVPHAYDRTKGDEAADLQFGRSIGIDGAQVNDPEMAAAALGRPVPTRIVEVPGPGGSVRACLLNAANGMALPGKPLDVELPDGSAATVAGDRDGCVAAYPDRRVSFAGDPAARASEGPGEAVPSPRGAHLSFTDDPETTATVTWFTDGLTDPGTTVEYGPATGEACSAADAFHRIEGRATKAPGVDVLAHEATMTGLMPGAAVCYRVGGGGRWSEVRSFHPADQGPFTFTVFGDHGTNPNSVRSTAAIAEEAPDLHLIAGDISYANGTQPIWDLYFDQFQSLASEVPVMAALGNHEVESSFGTEAFRTRLAQPGAELYYGFDYANVHFAVVDGGAALEEGILPAELAWLEQDLADAEARKASGEIDFIAVVQHFPLWSNHDTRGPCDPALVAVEEQILQRHGVDLLIVGHNHHFERSKPMVYGQPTTSEPRDYRDATGYIQVITGGGGQSLYSFVPPGSFATWSAAYARRFHYTRFEV